MLSRCFGEASLLQTLQSPTDSVTCCDFGANFLFAAGSRFVAKLPKTVIHQFDIFLFCGFVSYCYSDKLVRVWEWMKGQGFVEASYSPLSGHRYAITSVRFSPLATMLASSSSDGSTILWNARVNIFVFLFNIVHTLLFTYIPTFCVCLQLPEFFYELLVLMFSFVIHFVLTDRNSYSHICPD